MSLIFGDKEQKEIQPLNWDWFHCDQEKSTLCGMADAKVIGKMVDESTYDKAVDSYEANAPLFWFGNAPSLQKVEGPKSSNQSVKNKA